MLEANRAVGYCLNRSCKDFLRSGVLLGFTSNRYFCSVCREMGAFIPESFAWKGEGGPVREARVEYNFDPEPLTRGRPGDFLNAAVVRNDSLIDVAGRSFTFYSMLIRTEKRALSVAESILSNLNTYQDLSQISLVKLCSETTIHIDAEKGKFLKECADLGDRLRLSTLVA